MAKKKPDNTAPYFIVSTEEPVKQKMRIWEMAEEAMVVAGAESGRERRYLMVDALQPAKDRSIDCQ